MDYDSTAPEPAPVQPAQRDRTRLQAVGRERAVAVGLVVAAAVSPQVGAAFAVTLFDELGPAGAAFLRLAFAAIVLWAIWRPRLTGDLRLAGAFGVSLGLMNWSFYEAIARIPLGVAVTIEFAGPLLVAVIGSRRPLDGVWVALAAAGIVLLVDPGGGSMDPVGVALRARRRRVLDGLHLPEQAHRRGVPGRLGARDRDGRRRAGRAPGGRDPGGRARSPSPTCWARRSSWRSLSSVLPYSLELEALRRLPEAVFGVLMSLDPAVAALIGFVVLDQDLGARELARDRDGGRRQRRGGQPQSPMTSCRPDTRPRVPGCLAR